MSKHNNAEEFNCAKCNKTFKKSWSESEAKKEYEESSWFVEGDIIEVICDDCFLDFKKWVASLTKEDHAIIRNGVIK